jgi:hypothetical protein
MLPALQITVYPADRDQFRAMAGGRVVAVSDQPFQAASTDVAYPRTEYVGSANDGTPAPGVAPRTRRLHRR